MLFDAGHRLGAAQGAAIGRDQSVDAILQARGGQRIGAAAEIVALRGLLGVRLLQLLRDGRPHGRQPFEVRELFLRIVDLPVDRVVADDQRLDQEQVRAEYDECQQEERRQSADPGGREQGFTRPARPPRP